MDKAIQWKCNCCHQVFWDTLQVRPPGNYGGAKCPTCKAGGQFTYPVPVAKELTIETAIEQIAKCGFTCEGGPLENNVGWQWLVKSLTRATPEPVAPTHAPMVKLADVIAVIDDNQYALERVPVGWNLLVKIRAGINAIPVAPTPSPAPDIAGLDRKLRDRAHWNREAGHNDDAELDLEAAAALQRVAQERDAAILNMEAATETQNSATAALLEHELAAEARIATARDEGLEMAAKVVAGDDAWAAGRLARAIRALKGTKP